VQAKCKMESVSPNVLPNMTEHPVNRTASERGTSSGGKLEIGNRIPGQGAPALNRESEVFLVQRGRGVKGYREENSTSQTSDMTHHN